MKKILLLAFLLLTVLQSYSQIKEITGLNKIKFEIEFRKMLLLQKEN